MKISELNKNQLPFVRVAYLDCTQKQDEKMREWHVRRLLDAIYKREPNIIHIVRYVE